MAVKATTRENKESTIMAIELPEAYGIAHQMDNVLVGKTIIAAYLSQESASLIRQGFIQVEPANLTSLNVKDISSKGKWIFVHLSSDIYLLLALETGGQILFHKNQQDAPRKYHLKLVFEDNTALTICVVGWGFIKVVREDALERDRYPGKLGLSPVDEQAFTQQAFYRILESRKDTIKSILMDQAAIAGMGNGYAQEVLFRAKIHPRRKSADISEDEKTILYNTIINTLRNAIQLGGSENEMDLYSTPGTFRKVFSERKKVTTCPVCGTRIEKLVLGSSTYFCPSCQK
jgi:formamidopyrimidine-DNA glycosylase